MRDYAKISPSFWTGETGRRLRGLGPECQLLALYLITCHHATMLGLYYLPRAYIMADTGLSIEGATEALQSLSEAGFCSYDAPSEWVFVVEMARFQVLKDGEPLKAGDNRILGINREYRSMPSNVFLLPFYEKYRVMFHLTEPRGGSPSEAPPKPLRSQEQEQEQEHGDNDGREKGVGASPSLEDVRLAYNSLCPSLVPSMEISPSSVRWIAVKKVLGKYALHERGPLGFLEALFARAEASDLIANRDGKWRGVPAGLDWLLDENNYIRVLEGFYDNGKNRLSAVSGSGAHGRRSAESGKCTPSHTDATTAAFCARD